MRKLFSCLKGKARERPLSMYDEQEAPRVRRKVVVVGDGACGKTSLIQRFCRDTYSNTGYLPTVFDTDVTDVMLDHTMVELVVYDTAGQEDYDRLRPLSYHDTDVIIVCFSLDDPDSLANVLLNWVPEVRYFCGKVPLLLVGNKCDLRVHGELGNANSVGRAGSADSCVCSAGGATSRSCDSSCDNTATSLSCSSSSPVSTCSSCGDLTTNFARDKTSVTLIKQGPVKASEAKVVASRMGAIGYWETSAMLDIGVTEVFKAATRVALPTQKGKTGVGRTLSSFLDRFCLKLKKKVTE